MPGHLSQLVIGLSVGNNAANLAKDVRAVQDRLNLLAGKSRTPLKIDGIAGTKTKDAIGDFQTKVVGFLNPDRKVDPNKQTIAALNDSSSSLKWSGGFTPSVMPPLPDDLMTLPRIRVIGPTDGNHAFDSYPPPAQVLGPDIVSGTAYRDGAWMMVPVGRKRALTLDLSAGLPVQLLNDGLGDDGVIVSRLRGKLVKVSVNGRTLTVEGLGACRDCKIDVVQNGRHIRLYVSVKPRRTIPLFVYFVEHGPRRTARATPDDIRAAIAHINKELLGKQCNVFLEIEDETTLTRSDIGHRLGAVIDLAVGKDEVQFLRKFVRKSVRSQPSGGRAAVARNIFVVRELRSVYDDGSKGKVWGVAVDEDFIVLDDRSFGAITLKKLLAETLAHEVGHTLLDDRVLGHTHFFNGANIPTKGQGASHNPYRDALMHFGGRGTRIYRREIEKMNPTSFVPVGTIASSFDFS